MLLLNYLFLLFYPIIYPVFIPHHDGLLDGLGEFGILTCVAQGGGSFKNRKPIKDRLVVVNQGWQSEGTDGPTGG
jgi:hypothetical protein